MEIDREAFSKSYLKWFTVMEELNMSTSLSGTNPKVMEHMKSLPHICWSKMAWQKK